MTVITGEGGSGGALAIAVGDVVLALENAIYSVISPEGCASILWRDPGRGPAGGRRDAPHGGRAAGPRRHRHRHRRTRRKAPTRTPTRRRSRLGEAIEAQLDGLVHAIPDELVEARYARYRAFGAFTTADLPVRERRERQNLVDRLRTLLDRGRSRPRDWGGRTRSPQGSPRTAGRPRRAVGWQRGPGSRRTGPIGGRAESCAGHLGQLERIAARTSTGLTGEILPALIARLRASRLGARGPQRRLAGSAAP